MRLIDADSLKEELENSKHIFGANKTIEFIQNSEIDRAISFIETAPTVEERPHGEWVEVKRYNRKGKRFLDCSVCHYGEKGEIVCEVTKLPNFCPNCGASMSKLQANGEQVKTNQWCKFKSEKNCDFCAFHSDCEIHWKDGDE